MESTEQGGDLPKEGDGKEAKAHLNILGHPGNVIGSEKNHADGMYKASPRGYSLWSVYSGQHT